MMMMMVMMGVQWRDHWLGAIYYLPKALQLDKGSKFRLRGAHDELSLWFAAEPLHERGLTIL